MRVRRTGIFFNRFSVNILFSSLVSFAFLILVFSDMGIGGGIRQCRHKCRPMLVLRRQRKNAVVKVFTYAVFLFRFYSVIDNS